MNTPVTRTNRRSANVLLVALAATLLILPGAAPDTSRSLAGPAPAETRESGHPRDDGHALGGKPAPYTVMSLANGRASRWDPCAGPYTFKVNTAGLASAKQAAAIAEARWGMRLATKATGIEFAYRGRTREMPRTNRPVTGADVVIGYVTPKQTDYPLHGNTIGYGGAWYTGQALRRYAGYALVDTEQSRTWATHHRGGRTRPAILLHEIGHVLGLWHVKDPAQQMHAGPNTRTPAGWGPGDLRGLRKLGANSGCMPKK